MDEKPKFIARLIEGEKMPSMPGIWNIQKN
jgi:hypothetical protein